MGDVTEARDLGTRQLNLMLSGPSPAGLEEKKSLLLRITHKYVLSEQRLHEEQEETVAAVIRLINASTMEDFLKEGKNIMGGLFDDEEVGKFCENVCETWPSLSAVRDNVYTLSEKL